jgi:hypothetical protein
MRDGKLLFGDIANATKTTQVYSADTLDFGALQTGYTKSSKHRTGETGQMKVVFALGADMNAADTVVCIIQDSATNNADWTDLARGPTLATVTAGIIASFHLPPEHKRYLRASCYPDSSGTLTASTVTAWLEPGANN